MAHVMGGRITEDIILKMTEEQAEQPIAQARPLTLQEKKLFQRKETIS
jgi:hypothetical protein